MKIFYVTRKWGDGREEVMTVAANTIEQAVADAKRYIKNNYLNGEVKQVSEAFEVKIAYKH